MMALVLLRMDTQATHIYWNNLLYMQYGSIPYGNAGNLVSFDGSALPVTLINFKGKLNGDEAILTWSTAEELNNKGFEVERSFDGITFNDIGFETGHSNSNQINNYTYTDVKVAGGSDYYRLKQIDNDGRFNYSSVIKLDYAKFNWSVLGNPTPNNSWVQLQLDKQANISVQIFSINGNIIQIINKGALLPRAYSIPFSLNNATAGVYIIRLIVNNKSYTTKIIK